MKRFALTALALIAFNAAAQSNYTVQHNGTTQFSAAALNIAGTTWNFVDGVVQPPPAQGGNYFSGLVQYNFKTLYTYNTSFAELGSILGRNPPAVEVYPGYPFASGTTAVFTQARKGAVIVSHFKTPPTVTNLTLRAPYNVPQGVVSLTVAPAAAGQGITPGTVAGDCVGELLPNAVSTFIITSNPNRTQCQVQPNADYTLTQTLAVPCAAQICPFGIVEQH